MITEIWPALGLAGSFAVAVWVSERNAQNRVRKENQSLETCRYSVATIARNLAPKLKRLMTEDPAFASPTLYVIGGDGYPLWTDDSYPWRGDLKDVLKRGGNIHYLLTNASAVVIAKLSKLKFELENGVKGKVSFHFANGERAAEKDKEIIKGFHTFHPTLIEGVKRRAMWVEGYHPVDSTVAYSCKFTSPEDAETDPNYDRYKETILRLMDSYREVQPKAA